MVPRVVCLCPAMHVSWRVWRAGVAVHTPPHTPTHLDGALQARGAGPQRLPVLLCQRDHFFSPWPCTPPHGHACRVFASALVCPHRACLSATINKPRGRWSGSSRIRRLRVLCVRAARVWVVCVGGAIGHCWDRTCRQRRAPSVPCSSGFLPVCVCASLLHRCAQSFARLEGCVACTVQDACLIRGGGSGPHSLGRHFLVDRCSAGHTCVPVLYPLCTAHQCHCALLRPGPE
jgi:hypothetical protein